ncbi:SAP domain-containing ribonucleoprotein, partial [Stegodyphus mimosarum]
MADSKVSENEKVVISAEVQSLKIPDLKKRLQALGLPVTGSKMELMERLQTANISGNDVPFLTVDPFADEGRSNSFDDGNKNPEDDSCISLLDNDQTLFSSEGDSMKIVDNSIGDSKLSTDNPPSKPLKKGVAKGTESTVTRKKIQLNRTNVIMSTPKPLSPVKSASVIKTTQAGGKKKLSLKSMTDDERLAMRAKRFNVTPSAASLSKSEKSFRSSGSVGLTNISTSADLEVLKKRAERFGQNVSSVMKQIEEKERLLKRKFKFGASVSSLSAISSLDEQEKKRRR